MITKSRNVDYCRPREYRLYAKREAEPDTSRYRAFIFARKNWIKHGKGELSVIRDDGKSGALARRKQSGVVLYCIE